MSGYVVVVENPYFAKTGPAGTFRISGVPPGRYRLRCWHEQLPARERQIEVSEDDIVKVIF
jgi:hypothetical protein